MEGCHSDLDIWWMEDRPNGALCTELEHLILFIMDTAGPHTTYVMDE